MDFKEHIRRETVQELLTWVGGTFDRDAMLERASNGLETLELKARVIQVADVLRDGLPEDWLEALDALTERVPAPIEHTDALTDRFWLWPILTCIERHGLAHPEASLQALERWTPFFSAEFAVRPYFQADPDAMVGWVERWSRHSNVHVRRLASEGSRPRLPWGIRLTCRIEQPEAVLATLTRLRDDPSEYVRRSVANHLNDIAKDHPDVVLNVARDWLPSDKQTTRLVRHALRTQLKAGDPAVYRLLGFETFGGTHQVDITPNTLAIGESFQLELTLQSPTDDRVRLDYAIHHKLANGSLSPKIFHWTERALKAGKPSTYRKKHTMKKVTTRTLRPGDLLVDVRVNGQVVDTLPFTLLPE